MTEEAHTMIRFVPEGDGTSEGFTDASYHLPAFYELWARWGPAEDRAFWAKAADVSRQLFSTVTGPDTALTPERSNFDMSPMVDRNGNPTTFGYDSWRSASNWSVDYSWWHKDPRETILSDRIQKFLASQGIDKFVDRYTLDGKPLSERHSTGMLSTTAVGSLAATPGATEKAFVDALWNTPIPIRRATLLRRLALPDEPHALQRQLSHLATRQPRTLTSALYRKQNVIEDVVDRIKQRRNKPAADKKENQQRKHPHTVIKLSQLIWQKMAQDVASIERWQRNQVEHKEQQIDEDHKVKKERNRKQRRQSFRRNTRNVLRNRNRSSDRKIARGQQMLENNQQDKSDRRRKQIAGRSGQRDQDVITLVVLENFARSLA